MKWFTPERIVAYGSEDPATWKAGEQAWEEMIEEYDRYLDTIKHLFSPGLKMVADAYFLHDADVHAIGRDGHKLVVVLQSDTVQRTLLFLRYDLVEEPKIDRESLPVVARIGGIPQWQYDETEMVPGDPPTWRQSILLSNGWEITLHFRDVHVEEVPALLPEPRQSSLSPAPDLPQTA